eukprot:12541150-Ditylum_brightwellii.AAC.1
MVRFAARSTLSLLAVAKVSSFTMPTMTRLTQSRVMLHGTSEDVNIATETLSLNHIDGIQSIYS